MLCPHALLGTRTRACIPAIPARIHSSKHARSIGVCHSPEVQRQRSMLARNNGSTSSSWTSVEQKAYEAFATRYPTTWSSCMQVLTEAAYNKSVAPQEVEGAILCLEQQPESSKVQRNVDGRWRLVFGTATKLRFFQYLPVKEDFVIQVPEEKLALESSVGPFQFEVYGKIKAYRQELNALDFYFTGVNVLLFGYQVYKVVKDYPAKTYTFFHVGEDVAVARSSTGAVALLRPT